MRSSDKEKTGISVEKQLVSSPSQHFHTQGALCPEIELQ
jgi:hypothetical protein